MKTLEDIKNELANEIDMAVRWDADNWDADNNVEGWEGEADFAEYIKPIIDKKLDEAFELGKKF